MVSEPKVSTLNLDGLDKWSLNLRYRVEIVLEEPVSNLRELLSAKELPCHVTKFRISSGRIKP